MQSTTVASTAGDNVLCRAVADDKSNRTPLINLEGGRQISYVRCSCSKCQVGLALRVPDWLRCVCVCVCATLHHTVAVISLT
jgi:hypothetical protein